MITQQPNPQPCMTYLNPKISPAEKGLRTVTSYAKQTKVMLFFQITDDKIELLPLDIQNKLSSGNNAGKVEGVFKDKSRALSVTEVSQRYEISKEIIYENLDTLNYIESPILRHKIRLQDTSTTLPLKNQPIIISADDYIKYIR